MAQPYLRKNIQTFFVYRLLIGVMVAFVSKDSICHFIVQWIQYHAFCLQN